MQGPNMNRVQAILSEAREDELAVLAANPDLAPGVKQAIEGERKKRQGTGTGSAMKGLAQGMARNVRPSGQPVKMAQGGLVPQPAVIQEDGAVEPVPPGALPEEVADDVDVKLSEGEVVIPADVVRWHGLKTFEAMRSQAKRGLAQMDSEGRVQTPPADTQVPALPPEGGNGLVPKPDDMTMATGGVVAKQGITSPPAATARYGERMGNPSDPSYTADFIDSDGDGTDDRYQSGPGQNPAQSQTKTSAPTQPPATIPGAPTTQNPIVRAPNAATQRDSYADAFNKANPARPIVAVTNPYGASAYLNTDQNGNPIVPPPVRTSNIFNPQQHLQNTQGNGGGISLRPGSGSGGTGVGTEVSLGERVTGALTALAATAATSAVAGTIADLITGKGLEAALNENIIDPVTGTLRKVSDWLGITERATPAGVTPNTAPREGFTVSSTDDLAGGAGADALGRAGAGLVTNPLGAQVTPDLMGRAGWQFTDTGNATLNTGINVGMDIAGGYLGNKLSGMLTERTGQSWGSMIGGAGVAATASAGLFSAGSSLAFMALPGVGVFIGAFVGGVLGGQFGAKPSLGLNVGVNINNYSDKDDPWNASKAKQGDFRTTKPTVDSNGAKTKAVDDVTNVVVGISDAASDATKDILAKFGGTMTKSPNFGFEFVANPNREKRPRGSGQFVITRVEAGKKEVISRITVDEQGALKAVNELTAAMLRDSGAIESITDPAKRQQVENAMAAGNVLMVLDDPARRAAAQRQNPATTTPNTTTPAPNTPAQPTGVTPRPNQPQQQAPGQFQRRPYIQRTEVPTLQSVQPIVPKPT